MLMQPRRQKYRRSFRGNIKQISTRGNKLSFGDYGLKAMQPGIISAREIESARRSITHYTKRGGKVWIRIFPHLPITAKSAGSRMGSGKGNVVGFSTPIKSGAILFEIVGVSEDVAKEAFRLASHKISIKSKFVREEDQL